MKYFYDTCSLLNEGFEIFKRGEHFYISSITLKELENIKTSNHKDLETKQKAQKIIALLIAYNDLYTVCFYDNSWNEKLNNSLLSDNNDSKIIFTALQLSLKEEITFVTDDLCCYKIAEELGLKVRPIHRAEPIYTGYITVQYNTDDELADIYEKLYTKDKNLFDLKINQYLFIIDKNGSVVDKYKYTKKGIEQLISYCTFDSKMFGKTKPKDAYQEAAMDSLKNNQITALCGPAGSGKSYLALTYLFERLEKGKINKIIIFCNTVATAGAAKLGFYPGTRDEKLLDSQIGNFLTAKIGDKGHVEDMINRGQITLLPLSDIRGFDTTGMNAGIYITEAQNMDIEMMRLCLQRIGEDCVCILDGDFEAQVDLDTYAGRRNGLRRVCDIFKGQDFFGEVTLPNIYRSKIAKMAQEL